MIRIGIRGGSYLDRRAAAEVTAQAVANRLRVATLVTNDVERVNELDPMTGKPYGVAIIVEKD